MTNVVAGEDAQGRIPILLLKTRSIPTDGYEDYFNDSKHGNFDPTFVPVLEHKFKQDTLDWLKTTIYKGGFARQDLGADVAGAVFTGMIFTSQRAVEAFAEIVSVMDQNSRARLLPSNLPLYVVGPATAKGLRSLDVACQILGDETGNGEALAKYILDHHNKQQSTNVDLNKRKASLLFMVGEQRRDIIPKTLQSSDLPEDQRIEVVEKVIYETGEMASFQSDLDSLLTQSAAKDVQEQWIVVFSPTGCKAMLRSLGWLDAKTGQYSAGEQKQKQNHSTFIATIGPTTRDYLMKEFSFEPHVCAEKPSPEGIAAGIREFRVR